MKTDCMAFTEHLMQLLKSLIEYDITEQTQSSSDHNVTDILWKWSTLETAQVVLTSLKCNAFKIWE